MLVRLAVAGTRTDRVRAIVTALGSAASAFAWLCAATVLTLGLSGSDQGSAGDNPEYTVAFIRQPGLRPGVIATFVLMTIPVLALVVQCARLGAPARDRRIAAFRLAGATPGQAVAIGAGESGVAASIGALLGLVSYLVARWALDNPNHAGQRPLPTDVLPPVWTIVLICVGLPILVSLLAAALLRRVVTSPLGVVRPARRAHGPGPWPGLLILGGVGLFAVFGPLARYLPNVRLPVSLGIVTFYIGVLASAAGVALGAGWIAHTAGLILRRAGRRPASQLAAARLIADPWQGSRALGVLIVATLFGAGTAGVYANFAVTFQVRDEAERASALAQHVPYFPQDTAFYTNGVLLVAFAVGLAGLIAALGQLTSMTEAIVSRRRSNAALVATGVPRSVLARSTAWQTFVVAVPAVVLATVVGLLLARLFTGSSVSASTGAPLGGTETELTRAVPVPWPQLGVVVGGSLAAVLLTLGIGLLFLKGSTSVEELRTG